MKIVVASDSFKGSLSSIEVANSVARGIHATYPQCDISRVNVADGGEGTVDAIVNALQGEIVTTIVRDPLGRPIEAQYGIAGNTAIIEMAAASGLTLLQTNERNPWLTSTYGTGELIMDAIYRGCQHFFIGIGGSATNDAGIGMLQALGYRFYDDKQQEISNTCGGRLADIFSIDDNAVSTAVQQASFTIACDVDTPFCGKEGAAYVFAPQKGADAQMVQALDQGMAHFAQLIKDTYRTDITNLPGAGAAGGIGGTFAACLHATLTSGIDMVLDAIHFDTLIRDADLIITGEGKIDSQTAKGKTAAGILARATKYAIPVIAIAGQVEESTIVQALGFAAIFPIHDANTPLEVAMQPDIARTHIEKTMREKVATFIKNLNKK